MNDTKILAWALGLPLLAYIGYWAALEVWCLVYGLVY